MLADSANKNAINLRCKIFIIINLPPSAQQLFHSILFTARFLIYTMLRKIWSALTDRNRKFIAACFSLTFRLKKSHGRAASIRRFGFALCCIKRIAQYYPCGELTLTIFFPSTSGKRTLYPWRLFAKTAKSAMNYFFFNINRIPRTKGIACCSIH